MLSAIALGALIWTLLGGGAFACLYGYISLTDPRLRNRRHGYLFTAVGIAALGAFVTLWLRLR
jgi:hypothetical protein